MPYIKVDDINFYFEIVGSELEVNGAIVKEKPTLLVIHGGPGVADHTLYTEFWGQFQKQAQVIFIDMRGCGRTENGDPALWNLKQCTDDVNQFLQKLGIKKPIIAGVSWGGHVALSYAIQFPNHPAALILCNTEAHVSKERRREFFRKISGSDEIADIVWKFDNGWTPQLQADFAKYCMPYFSKRAYTKEELDRCIKNPARCEKFFKEEFYSFDCTDSLAKIKCQVLYLAGRLDPAHPYPCAEETSSKIAQSELHIIEEAADPVYRDCPEEAFTLINAFIQRISHEKRLTANCNNRFRAAYMHDHRSSMRKDNSSCSEEKEGLSIILSKL